MRITARRVCLTLLVVGLAATFGPAIVQLIRMRTFGSEVAHKGSVFKTEMTIVALRGAIDFFETDFCKLPPMTFGELADDPRWAGLGISGNTTNECNECLLVALRHPDLSRPFGDPGPSPLGNTDGDAWNRVPAGCDSADATELLDGFGNPVIYITAARYGEPVRIRRGDGKTVDVRAVRRRSGAFYNPNGYQLISLGADGTQDADDLGDDIQNFIRDAD